MTNASTHMSVLDNFVANTKGGGRMMNHSAAEGEQSFANTLANEQRTARPESAGGPVQRKANQAGPRQNEVRHGQEPASEEKAAAETAADDTELDEAQARSESEAEGESANEKRETAAGTDKEEAEATEETAETLENEVEEAVARNGETGPEALSEDEVLANWLERGQQAEVVKADAETELLKEAVAQVVSEEAPVTVETEEVAQAVDESLRAAAGKESPSAQDGKPLQGVDMAALAAAAKAGDAPAQAKEVKVEQVANSGAQAARPDTAETPIHKGLRQVLQALENRDAPSAQAAIHGLSRAAEGAEPVRQVLRQALAEAGQAQNHVDDSEWLNQFDGEADSEFLGKLLERIDPERLKSVLAAAGRGAEQRAAQTDLLDQFSQHGVQGLERANPLSAAAARTPLNTPGSALPQYTLSLPLDNAQWGQQLNQRMVWMMRNEMQGAELRLNPPELGAITVRINMSQDQASVMFSAQHANVRDAIESALPRLREMLAESGLNLANADVGSQLNQQQGRERQDEADGADKLSGAVFADGSEGVPEGGMRGVVSLGDGLVDYYA